MDSRRQALKLPENLDYALEHGIGKQSASAGRKSEQSQSWQWKVRKLDNPLYAKQT